MTQAQLSAFIQNQPRQPSPEEMIRGEEAAKQMTALRDKQGLIDVSAFIVPRAMYGSAFKNPLTGPAMKKMVVEPPLFRAGRKAQSGLMTRGTVAGSGAALGSEAMAGVR